MLQFREKEIFETLKEIKKFHFAIIGGYAVNAYTLPRFSVDCDIVIKDELEARKIRNILNKLDYKEVIADEKLSYTGKFIRYEKKIDKNFKVSVDILIKEVFDRQSNCKFSAEWIFHNSAIKQLRGKTITETLKLRIINIDALIVMKFICARIPDIRDVFMLLPNVKNKEWIKNELAQRYDFEKVFKKIKDKVTSAQFRNDLQGVFGYIDSNIFEKHKKALIELKK